MIINLFICRRGKPTNIDSASMPSRLKTKKKETLLEAEKHIVFAYVIYPCKLKLTCCVIA